MTEFLESLNDKLCEEKNHLENLSSSLVRQYIVSYMMNFFGQNAAIQTISLENEDLTSSQINSSNKEDVNDIILQIEMRKF